MPTTDADFKWNDDETVCLRCQPATAVYRNQAGEIVIRQEASWNEESDSCVLIARQNVRTVIDAIAREAGINVTIVCFRQACVTVDPEHW
jgi:hypothetical protein